MKSIIKNPLLYLLLILFIAFAVRTYKIDNPVADWHAWRQADTASVARYFYQHGYNPMIPKYDDMSGVAEKPVPNPERYRFVEFPIYNTLVYLSYLLNNGVDEKLARLISVIFSLGSIIFLYFITKKYFSISIALLTALIFAILPFNVYFSRVILPEPLLVFLCLGMFLFTSNWLEKGSKLQLVLSIIFSAAAFLTKPMAIFYFLPLIYLFFATGEKLWPINKKYLFFLLAIFIPFVLWRVWISQHPEGIPASNWLLNGDGIRFKPIFWYWVLQERLGTLILGASGTLLFTVGFLIKPLPKEGKILHILGLSLLLYLIVFATGNVRHDYYQVMIVPVLAIFISRGFILLTTGVNNFVPRIFTIPLAIVLLFTCFYTTWQEVKGFYQINNPVIVEAGKRADMILPKNAVVVAPYNGDTSFLYYTNRPGWPFLAYPLNDLIDKYGVTHYISTTKDPKTAYYLEKYQVLVNKPEYMIIDVTKLNPAFDILKDQGEPK